jgi:dihydroflavonol-4-reductase
VPQPDLTNDAPFLVTGASGFIALHLIRLLLERGHRVRGTLRRSELEPTLRAALARHVTLGERLELVSAELARDEGWDLAAHGTRGVFHVASPVPRRTPAHEDELIVPARDGALRVLRAARNAGAPRVVLTSSDAAVTAASAARATAFSEKDWTNLEQASAYEKSKTLAERAAWDWVQANRPSPELVSVNPVFVLGPLLWSNYSPSLEVVRELMTSALPGLPDLSFPLVDVRDVAQAHYLAMVRPEAAGQRFICGAGAWSMVEIARVLREHLAPRGFRIPSRRLPNWAVRTYALFDPTARMVTHQLGVPQARDSSRIRSTLGWQDRDVGQTIRDTADSLIEHGIVKVGRSRTSRR